MTSSALIRASFVIVAALGAGCTRADKGEWMMPAASGVTVPGLPPVTGRIHIDQFGYLPDAKKVAVISDPQKGFNAAESYAPGEELEVRRADDGAVVHRGVAEIWMLGKTDASSGDRGWWFDFSELSATGSYYVFDPGSGLRSHVFDVGPDVYRDVLRAAVRVFHYQRQDFVRRTPFAEEPWTDGAMFPQDRTTRALWAKDDPATERDMHGGWMDAGDSNKYVTFLRDVIHPLLYAWQRNPAVFTDDFGIPESGNGLPDLLDEVMYELRWLVRMQDADGGFFIKQGTIDYNTAFPLSADRRPRYYGPKCSSATIIACANLAHAARVFGEFEEWKAEAADFAARAERAWTWYHANPRSTDCDSGEIKSGDADKSLEEQDASEATAAMHLFALTGRAAFHDAFRRKYASTRQMQERNWSPYEPGNSESLIEYTTLNGAHPAVREEILGHLRRAIGTAVFTPRPREALYRAFMTPNNYHWGSNFVRAAHGVNALCAIDSGAGDGRGPELRQRALDLLHSFHGVNPLGFIYLSNMERHGGEVSALRIWHDWFNVSTPFANNPAPGYVAGGPNRFFNGEADAVAWIAKQPPEKAYADFNHGHPFNSWELTEPAIYNQALYIRLLSAFVPAQPRGAE